MNVHLLSSPMGFSDAISIMNNISSESSENFSFVVNEVFKHERSGCGIQSILSKQNNELQNIDKDQLNCLVNALGHIYRGCVEHKVIESGSSLINALNTCTEATEATASILASSWATSVSSNNANDSLNRALSVGRLVSLDWKLGVALSSSSCNSLLAPFVTLVFHVTDVNGNNVAERVEFTYAEFQSVSKTLSEVAAKLDKL